MQHTLFIESGKWITEPSQMKMMCHFGVVTTSSSGWSLGGAYLQNTTFGTSYTLSPSCYLYAPVMYAPMFIPDKLCVLMLLV